MFLYGVVLSFLLRIPIRMRRTRILLFKGDLAIRHIFSLVDMITKPKFSNCPNIFKIGLFRRESIKIGFKAIHHLQSRENLRLLLPPLVLRLYTGHRLHDSFSKSFAGFQKVKVLKY